MALFDALMGQNPNNAALSSGLLNMGAGLLAGSTGHYGQFGPALAQGLAGFGAGVQNAQDSHLRQQQIAQAKQFQDLRARQLENDMAAQERVRAFFQPPQAAGGAQTFPVGSAAESLDDRIQKALTSPEPELREWGLSMLRSRNASQQPMSGLVPTDKGYAFRNADGTTSFLTGPDGQPLMPVSLLSQDPNRQRDIAAGKGYGTQIGKGMAESELSMPADLAQIDNMERSIDNILNHPGLPWAVGAGAMIPKIPGTAQADFIAASNQLEGQAFLQAFESLKGGGQITEIEGQKATQAIARLDRAQSREEYTKSLNELKEVLNAARQRIQSRGRGGATAGTAPVVEPFNTGVQAGPARITTADEYNRLPSGAQYIDPNGQLRTKR